MSKQTPIVFDDDNPEWTKEDFARARPISDFPELLAAFPKTKVGRPKGSAKELVSIRIDHDILEKLRAGGSGWQSRVNALLRKAVG